jgi:N-acetylglucosamine-6-phosphate deacetylase
MLAPENQPAGTIARLTAMGVVVSVGHSAADAEATRAALAEGARAFTHLHNAMTPMTARAPGVVGVALDSEAFCGLIADGFYVAAEALRVSIRARPRPDRMVIVSDAMPTVGRPDHFELYGETIRLVDGKLVNRAGSLAGVHIDQAQSVRNLIDVVGVAPEAVLAMATFHPAAMMKLDALIGGIAVDARADLIVLDDGFEVLDVL